MRIWLDDIRPTPDGYDVSCVSALAVMEYIKEGTVTHVSLDHDLGAEWAVGNGYMVAKLIEELAYFNKIPRLTWAIHSQNSVGVASMRVALENADRSWTRHGK
jgi:hypothetical protein